MRELNIAIREMAYFLYSSGDLTRDFFSNVDPDIGKECHRFWQDKYQETDEKEYYVSLPLDAKDCSIMVKGFIDGVLNQGTLIEEIKSTFLDVSNPDFIPFNEHVMQLKLYCYMYCKEKMIPEIDARLTYITANDHLTRFFEFHYLIDDLEKTFFDSIFEYLDWKIKLDDQNQTFRKTIEELNFPFPSYRRGQREYMKYVYQTILDKDILYAIAPTGIGKTMASLYASLKTIKKDNKIFYLTAKSLGKSVCLNAMEILKNQGLMAKTIELSNKDKMCFLPERNCDIHVCPFMKEYFNHLHQAIKELYEEEDIWSFDKIRKMALKHRICAFEYSLDLSYLADIIIADYNYAFCPRTHLVRYFEDDTYKPILLVDEAHNLVARSKDMYSAKLDSNSLLELKRLLSKIKPKPGKVITDLTDYIKTYGEALGDVSFFAHPNLPTEIIQFTFRLQSRLETLFRDNLEFPTRGRAMQIYFDILRFNKISKFYNHNFRFIYETSFENRSVSISCLDASEFIYNTIRYRSFGTIFFSATMYPLPYYQMLLTGGKGESLIIPSPFDSNHLKLIMKTDVSTKYQDRSASVSEIIQTIDALISYKKGNYIVFFPSYEYLNLVVSNLKNPPYEVLLQERDMTEEMRQEMLSLFSKSRETQVAFFVMGGSFAEGIDYLGDMLSGVLIVSVCLPMYNDGNNLLVDHFNEKFNDGFNYAYTYPGITKVVQAVGRVIRSETDRGVAILLDTRFKNSTYQRLMPQEWKNIRRMNNIEYIKEEIELFKGGKNNENGRNH